MMAAHLRLPEAMIDESKEAYVDGIIQRLGMTKSADTIVGDAKVRRVSDALLRPAALCDATSRRVCQLWGAVHALACMTQQQAPDRLAKSWCGGRDAGPRPQRWREEAPLHRLRAHRLAQPRLRRYLPSCGLRLMRAQQARCH